MLTNQITDFGLIMPYAKEFRPSEQDGEITFFDEKTGRLSISQKVTDTSIIQREAIYVM